MNPPRDLFGGSRFPAALAFAARLFSAVVAVAVAVVFSLVGCAAPNQQMVEDKFDIPEAAGTPEITEVVDVGGGDVPLTGTLAMESSDGVAVIGETLWLRGRSFGRQPTVLVGGRPAAVLGRTRDGGIVVRVPPTTPSGSVPVIVSNEVGKGERPMAVRRYAAVLVPGSGRIGWVEIGNDGPIAAGRASIAGAQMLALSSDGRAAYLLQGDRGLLDVINLPSPGNPKAVYRLDLGPERPLALAAAARAPVLAVVRGGDLIVVDTSSPLRPARSAPRQLPPEVRQGRLVGADVSPDGKLLAVATEEGNRVLLLDLVPRGRAPLVGSLSVVPDVRESVLVDLAFSPNGDTLWVLSGDTARSRPVGPQPTQLHAIRLASDPQSLAKLEVARVVRLEGAADPARLGLSRALPLASGGAIRLPPERTTVFVAAATRPPSAVGTAAVFRVGADDTAAVSVSAPGRFGWPDVTSDGRWLLVPSLAADGSVRLLATTIDGRPSPALRPADVVGADPGASPGRAGPLPQFRIQP